MFYISVQSDIGISGGNVFTHSDRRYGSVAKARSAARSLARSTKGKVYVHKAVSARPWGPLLECVGWIDGSDDARVWVSDGGAGPGMLEYRAINRDGSLGRVLLRTYLF